MRAHALSITLLLLLVPLAAGTSAITPRTPSLTILGAVPLLPADLPDAQLMLMLARLDHPDVRLVPRTLPTPSDTLALAATRVGAAAGVVLTAEDQARLDSLDPAIQVPLLTLFVTIEQANGMIADARAELSDEEARQMVALRDADLAGSPEYRALQDQVDAATLINAAILVTDTVESVVVPALQTAIAAGAWPAAGVWDPVGVLRLGSTGDDVETLDRIVQIDPSGNDVHRKNAGGATTFDPLYGPFNIITPIAISIDFTGNDEYNALDRRASAQGGSELGFGLLYDFAGSDTYVCRVDCQGGGLAIHRDHAGSDTRRSGNRAIGVGAPLAVLRDDAGDDNYSLTTFTGGYSSGSGETGLLWDRAGTDRYATDGFPNLRLGWALSDGRGLFVDEGPETDYYGTTEWPREPEKHGCNDCTWYRGSGHTLPRPGGRGMDNTGGLGAMLVDIGP